MSSDFMGRAVELSTETIGGPFGAVIIKDVVIIGEGCNSVVPHCDPTAHAEIMAIRDACQHIKTHHLDGCEIYTSCYPCSMCLSAIYWSGIKRIVYANTRHDAEDIDFTDKFIYKQLRLPDDEKSIEIDRNIDLRAKRVLYNWSGQKY